MLPPALTGGRYKTYRINHSFIHYTDIQDMTGFRLERAMALSPDEVRAHLPKIMEVMEMLAGVVRNVITTPPTPSTPPDAIVITSGEEEEEEEEEGV